MILFRSLPKPIWRQSWLHFLVMSGGMAGVACLVWSLLPSTWTKSATEWLTLTQPWVSPAMVTTNPEALGEAALDISDASRMPHPQSALEPELAVTLHQLNPEGVVRPYLTLTQWSYILTQQVLQQHQASTSYDQAINLANQAFVLRKQGNSLVLSQQEKVLWQDAVRALQSIESSSTQYAQAQRKLKEYDAIATVVNHRIHQHQSKFLIPIAAAKGSPNAVRIALCQLGTDDCRSFQGNVPPVSLASLVKLPLAVALMHQVTSGKASLDEQIYIDPSNFTENARGAKIFVDKTYTLREVMVRMITESNNIATNQLVDYMGYTVINSALKAEGFSNTIVGHKLVGNSTYPQKMGAGKNQSTADELTQMMMRIYSFTKASDEEILNALVGQYDLDFGYRALIREKPNIFWIGEKTGQNSAVIGTTVAFKVGEERYVMTVTIDKSADQGRLRQIIRDVARHVWEHGPLDQLDQPHLAPKVAQRL